MMFQVTFKKKQKTTAHLTIELAKNPSPESKEARLGLHTST